jgi:hypothetical protein
LAEPFQHHQRHANRHHPNPPNPSPRPRSREAKDSADEDGKFAIGLRISVLNGAPAKLKVKCSISKTITDEIESQVDDPEQMKLL